MDGVLLRASRPIRAEPLAAPVGGLAGCRRVDVDEQSCRQGERLMDRRAPPVAKLHEQMPGSAALACANRAR